MQLYTLFLHPGALNLAEARVAPPRLHVVAGNEARARRVAAEEAFADHLAKKAGLTNPWFDIARAGCAAFAPRKGPARHPFGGEIRRVGPFGPIERHSGVSELTPEMRLLKIRSHAAKIEDRPVSDEEAAAEAWDLVAPDGARAVAWKQYPIFAAHRMEDGLELFRFPYEPEMFRFS